MKRSSESTCNDWDDENAAPAGMRSSGVRRRGEPSSLDQPAVHARGLRPAEPGSAPEPPGLGFEEVHRRYRSFIWWRIRDLLTKDPSAADDVHQRVFIRLARRMRQEGVPHPLMPVLLGLVDDEVRNHARAAKRRPSDDEPDSELPTSKPDPEQLLSHAEHGVELERAVEGIFARMDGEDVALIRVAHINEEPPQDIADRMGITVNHLRVKLHRARARFAKLFLRYEGSRRKP